MILYLLECFAESIYKEDMREVRQDKRKWIRRIIGTIVTCIMTLTMWVLIFILSVALIMEQAVGVGWLFLLFDISMPITTFFVCKKKLKERK